jgi:tetratricopeptide (TPR) repeat protein
MIPPNMGLDSESITIRNQLASDWMHRGMALAEAGTPASLEEAIGCFDEVIALRQTLLLAENPWFRYGLSAGWINRGDAEARLDGPESLQQAIASYDEALELLRDLPLAENPLYPRRLAITWINRGAALQKLGTAGASEAARGFAAAIAVLEASPAEAIADRRLLQAGAWTNLAGALVFEENGDTAKIRDAVQKALGFAEGSEETDLVGAQTSFQARRLLCRLAVRLLAKGDSLPQEMIEEATDAADGAAALARQWESRGEGRFREAAREIFCFGCRIYQACQPQFLAEYVLECLDPEKSTGAFMLDQNLYQSATAAIWAAADQIQREGFPFVSTPEFEGVLSALRELRAAEDRLKQLNRGEFSIQEA